MFLAALFAIFHQPGVGFGHDELVFHRNGRDFDAQQLRRALCMVTRCGDHMFGGDNGLFIRRHQITALFHHLGDGDAPFAARPFIPVDLPAAFDHHATLARTLGHGHGHIGRVDIAVRRVVDRTLQIIGTHQRPAVLDLRGGHPFMGHIAGFRDRGIEHIFIHAVLRLCHAQVAHHRKPRVQAGFCL